MKRRDFLQKTIPAATLLPALINGYSVKAFAADSPLVQALMQSTTIQIMCLLSFSYRVVMMD